MTALRKAALVVHFKDEDPIPDPEAKSERGSRSGSGSEGIE